MPDPSSLLSRTCAIENGEVRKMGQLFRESRVFEGKGGMGRSRKYSLERVLRVKRLSELGIADCEQSTLVFPVLGSSVSSREENFVYYIC